MKTITYHGVVKPMTTTISTEALDRIERAPEATHIIAYRLWADLQAAIKASQSNPSRSHKAVAAHAKIELLTRQLMLNFGSTNTFWSIEAFEVFHALDAE